MRELTSKQKKILTKWFNENKNTLYGFDLVKILINRNIEIYEELEKINDTEVLYQNVNGFLNDLLHK